MIELRNIYGINYEIMREMIDTSGTIGYYPLK